MREHSEFAHRYFIYKLYIQIHKARQKLDWGMWKIDKGGESCVGWNETFVIYVFIYIHMEDINGNVEWMWDIHIHFFRLPLGGCIHNFGWFKTVNMKNSILVK